VEPTDCAHRVQPQLSKVLGLRDTLLVRRVLSLDRRAPSAALVFIMATTASSAADTEAAKQIALARWVEARMRPDDTCIGKAGDGERISLSALWEAVLKQPRRQALAPSTSADTAAETTQAWYAQGEGYWKEASPDDDGVLGGLAYVHPADVRESGQFLDLLRTTCGVGGGRVLDCGAGVGRVSEHLLARFFSRLDLLEQDRKMLETARDRLARAGMCAATAPIWTDLSETSTVSPALESVVSPPAEADHTAEGAPAPALQPAAATAADGAESAAKIETDAALETKPAPALAAVTDTSDESTSGAGTEAAKPTAAANFYCCGLQGLRFPSLAGGETVESRLSELPHVGTPAPSMPPTSSECSAPVAVVSGRAGTYDCIWLQWVIGCVLDTDFIALLQDAAAALTPPTPGRSDGFGGGVIVIKDNVLLRRPPPKPAADADDAAEAPTSDATDGAEPVAAATDSTVDAGAAAGSASASASGSGAAAAAMPAWQAQRPLCPCSYSDHFYMYDKDDHSISRSERYLLLLLERAGMEVVAAAQQEQWDFDLFPVMMYALRPRAWLRSD